MLILTRRRNESVHIGADVTVKVLGIHGNQIRLGITARVMSSSIAKKFTNANSPNTARPWTLISPPKASWPRAADSPHGF
jgi:sRNA-binding carbon storage regulator CsrA